MRKLSNYFFVAIAALTMVFTSCSDDTDPLGPNITFKAGDKLTVGDVTVNQGDTIYFSWEVIKGDANLSEFTIRNGALDVTGFPNTDIDKEEYQDTYATILLDAGSYVFTFIATDKDGLQDIKTIEIVANAAAAAIKTYSITLGSYDNTSIASSFASIDGTVLSLADAKANSAKIDFIYGYGKSNSACIMAPSDTYADQLFGLTGWATLNATKFFSSSLTATEFDAVSDASGITIAGTASSLMTSLSVGDVFVFKTAVTSSNPDKNGIAKVVAVTGTYSGTIQLSVKVSE